MHALQIGTSDPAHRVVDAIAADLPFVTGDGVVLLINGLGGTPLQALYLFNLAVSKQLDARELKVQRT